MKLHKKSLVNHKVKAFNLQEILIVLAIIGILLLLALPNLMPYISKAKSIEAQTQLKAIHSMQTQYRYLYSRYSNDFNEIDFQPPITADKGGTARYRYEITAAEGATFKARAEAVEDFDGDGVRNVWEIDEKGNPKEIVKD
ncbi:prepilin-type N-terminal cleavage/methylation domain-containing protein [Kordia algicida OT-1]|uniref:Possible type II general secretion pathway (GSP) G protein n=1 Tax=Kordia algicida OT-1 TaxID=391587 RepID=A9EC65_9FLAO|nr:prepilin-type N-terminal cleavage/methylation domain-containing protein [Kordia algicida]EDP94445.1 possible type II general secretion pathway (GSP) G protein [Kordia algicida OT-1]